MFCCSANRVRANLNQHNTPLVTQVCEGEITVTDPTHPLFGRKLKLAGMARLPGHVRHCHVELLAGHFAFVPVASTNLSEAPRPHPTVLTLNSIKELVATFQTLAIVRRRKNATGRKSPSVGSARKQRTKGSRRGNRSRSRRGGRK